MGIDISAVLGRLAEVRPVFHSEADFQHALAWELQRTYPEAAIRLEYRVPRVGIKLYADVWVEFEGQKTAIELKYKTRRLECEITGEPFSLRDQGAQDQGRYDYCRDIARIELIRSSHPAVHGVAVFLTNDSSYWKPKLTSSSVDTAFRLCDGTYLQGKLDWLSHASEGTKQGRAKSIQLENRYRLTWKSYSTLPVRRYAEFRYLLVETSVVEGLRGVAKSGPDRDDYREYLLGKHGKESNR